MKWYIKSSVDDDRKSLARETNDPKILEKLADDKDETVRWVVSNNPNTPAKVLEKLAQDKDEYVLEGVAKNPNTSARTLEKLPYDNYSIGYELAYNPNTPTKVLAKLADDGDGSIRTGVARNQNAPTKVLAKLADDGEWPVRTGVADNLNASSKILEELLYDEDGRVAYRAAKNPNTPIQTIEKLIDKFIDVRWGAAINPNISSNILMKLADDEDAGIRENVAKNPNTPAKVLAKLADDEEWKVRMMVARNPSTPTKIFAKLADDRNWNVRARLGENPNVPAKVLAKLAYEDQDEDRFISEIVAENPNTSSETIDILINDDASNVRKAARKRWKELHPGEKLPRYKKKKEEKKPVKSFDPYDPETIDPDQNYYRVSVADEDGYPMDTEIYATPNKEEAYSTAEKLYNSGDNVIITEVYPDFESTLDPTEVEWFENSTLEEYIHK